MDYYIYFKEISKLCAILFESSEVLHTNKSRNSNSKVSFILSSRYFTISYTYIHNDFDHNNTNSNNNSNDNNKKKKHIQVFCVKFYVYVLLFFWASRKKIYKPENCGKPHSNWGIYIRLYIYKAIVLNNFLIIFFLNISSKIGGKVKYTLRAKENNMATTKKT